MFKKLTQSWYFSSMMKFLPSFNANACELGSTIDVVRVANAMEAHAMPT